MGKTGREGFVLMSEKTRVPTFGNWWIRRGVRRPKVYSILLCLDKGQTLQIRLVIQRGPGHQQRQQVRSILLGGRTANDAEPCCRRPSSQYCIEGRGQACMCWTTRNMILGIVVLDRLFNLHTKRITLRAFQSVGPTDSFDKVQKLLPAGETFLLPDS